MVQKSSPVEYWNKPYSAGCQISHLSDFNRMTENLEAIGFAYNGKDTIDITIKNDQGE